MIDRDMIEKGARALHEHRQSAYIPSVRLDYDTIGVAAQESLRACARVVLEAAIGPSALLAMQRFEGPACVGAMSVAEHALRGASLVCWVADCASGKPARWVSKNPESMGSGVYCDDHKHEDDVLATAQNAMLALVTGKKVPVLKDDPTRCHAGRDGDCDWELCPQEAHHRRNYKSSCPLLLPEDDER